MDVTFCAAAPFSWQSHSWLGILPARSATKVNPLVALR